MQRDAHSTRTERVMMMMMGDWWVVVDEGASCVQWGRERRGGGGCLNSLDIEVSWQKAVVGAGAAAAIVGNVAIGDVDGRRGYRTRSRSTRQVLDLRCKLLLLWL